MLRRISFVAVAVATLAALSADLGACGDKFLRAGRSARFRRYAAIHPASILLYAPAPAWTNTGVKDFEAMLKKAGHKPFAVRNVGDFSEAISARKYDVVIALYADAMLIKAQMSSVPSAAALLPVLYRPTDPVAMEAVRTYQWLIRPDKMDKFQALEKIDELLSIRQKGLSTAAGTH
jgi:hypothetical protein